MPNWCKNEWDVSAETKEQAEHVRALLMTGEGEMTFEGFAPMPKVLYATLKGSGRDENGETIEEGKAAFPDAQPGDDGFGVYRPFTEEEEKALAAPECHGHRDWYSWANDVWGVKWEPSEVEWYPEDGVHKVSVVDRWKFSVNFQTPWGPPEAALVKLRATLAEKYGEDAIEIDAIFLPEDAWQSY